MSVYIIAEAGVNHNGSVDRALELVDYASEAGCDCVKFQFFHTEKLVTASAKKAEYQIENTKNDDSQFSMLKALELKEEDFLRISGYCAKKGIDFLATPFDEEAADQLERMNVSAYKVSSGDITNKPMLEHLARKGKKILLSTGMSTLEETERAVSWITAQGNNDIVLFHCTSDYPAPFESVNLRAMNTLQERFGLPTGYSDHTEGIEISIMASAMGASYIEKHFTYDKRAEGPDHKASLSPEELKNMVRAIRHVEAAFGDGIKQPVRAEYSTRQAARKSLVWTRDLKAGHRTVREDICCKRPGTGLEPFLLEDLIGCVLSRDCRMDELIRMEDLEKS